MVIYLQSKNCQRGAKIGHNRFILRNKYSRAEQQVGNRLININRLFIVSKSDILIMPVTTSATFCRDDYSRVAYSCIWFLIASVSGLHFPWMAKGTVLPTRGTNFPLSVGINNAGKTPWNAKKRENRTRSQSSGIIRFVLRVRVYLPLLYDGCTLSCKNIGKC